MLRKHSAKSATPCKDQCIVFSFCGLVCFVCKLICFCLKRVFLFTNRCLFTNRHGFHLATLSSEVLLPEVGQKTLVPRSISVKNVWVWERVMFWESGAAAAAAAAA